MTVTRGRSAEPGGRTSSSGGADAAAAEDRVLRLRDSSLGELPAHIPDRRPMPADYTISLAAKGATDRMLMRGAGGRRLQPMRGFDANVTDIIDYILRVTHAIWEEKAIGYLYEHYRSTTRVVDDHGIVYGRDKVIEETTKFLSAFPDLRLYPDEIVWAGDDTIGFWTSHRTVLIGHNTGYSDYGPPTGKQIVVTCIANCVSKDNQIIEEFVIYNTGSLLRQLGFDLQAKAREVAGRRLSGLDDRRAGEVERLLGQGSPAPMPSARSAGPGIEDAIRTSQHDIWNWRMLNRVNDAYAPNFRFHGPTDRELYGIGQYKAYILSLLAMFPDLSFQIDDLYWMGNDDDGYITSMRWSLAGTHRGPGFYGSPTGRRVHMWGITQHRVELGRITEEWTVSNEFDVLQQIYRDTPACEA
jgi:predicted ester cyclase